MAHRISSVLLSLLMLCLLSVSAFAAGKGPMLSGSFLQLGKSNLDWTPEKWRSELQAMRKLGMDTLIIQSCAGDSGAYYVSKEFAPYEKMGCVDPVGTIMELCDSLGIRVFLGLHAHGFWQPGGASPLMGIRCTSVANELAARYATRKSFAGWYIPQEFCDWIDPKGRLAKTYRELTDLCHRLTPGKPVGIAPYFGQQSLDTKACRAGWEAMLPALGVDLVMLQDGVGCTRGLTPENIVPVFRAVSEVCRAQKVKFWADVEVFDQRSWTPAPLDRILAQMRAADPFVTKQVTWEFNHYMSPVRGGQPSQLYEDYRRALIQAGNLKEERPDSGALAHRKSR